MIGWDEAVAWLERFQACAQKLDYEAARSLFDEQVLGFGSLTDVMKDRAALEKRQWREVWPRIKDFCFETETLNLLTEPPANIATLACLWRSLGATSTGSYERRGRVTMTLRKRDERLICFHSHFSMLPGDLPLTPYTICQN